MAAVPAAVVSASICIQFDQEQYPRTLEAASNLFLPYGDIARMDMTLGATTGRILVTYFDIRSAQRVLEAFPGAAELFPPAAHDFRAVSIAASTFVELPNTFGGFHAFGEIAGVSICGLDMVVEFYDMRAAQQVTFTVPGSRPRRPLPLPTPVPTPFGSPAFPESPMAQNAGEAQTFDFMNEVINNGQGDDIMPPGVALAQGSPKGDGAYDVAGWSDLAAPVHPPANVQVASSGPQSAGPGKPVREKVSTKDLTKFDIVPDKIVSGEDVRTTVMVRNIPKACSREAFVSLLNAAGLDERYSFFYMPFDKRRNIHCGFAFINFRMPDDVLKLYQCMQRQQEWRKLTHGPGNTQPALSYARLQGQDQLVKHFSLSAVMYDNDARKRPMFCEKEKIEISEEPERTTDDCTSLQPRYVSLQDATNYPDEVAVGG
mmetsp:Transcript_42831/g.81958  ORF Transcript_42831/g.81958 Transcript_42831/m.81958 type:complete len:430 (+) Transcript_42831:58-1347(+)